MTINTELYESLLRERETRAIRATSIVRLVVGLLLLVSVAISGFPDWLKLLYVSMAIPFVPASIYLYTTAHLRERHSLYIYGAAVLDGFYVAMIPLLQYLAAGGPETTPAYLLKADSINIAAIIIVAQVVTFRKAPPLIVAGIFIASKIVFLVWAINHAPIPWTSSLKEAYLGEAVAGFKLRFDSFILPMVLALLSMIFAMLARKNIVEAVDADSANLTKSQFLASISHELRTPLNAIIGYSEMIKEEMEEAKQQEYVTDLEKIRGSGRHLLNLIDNLLDLSKIEAGKLDIVPESFGLDSFLDDIVSTSKPLIEKNENQLVLHTEFAPSTITADALRLKQCLLNLVSNAAKFTHQGIVTLSVATRDGLIQFEVTDTGIGMSADQLNNVFKEFTQAKTTTARKYGGTGLGLAITRKLARLMGGDINARSEEGQGSSFVLSLPTTSG